MEKSKVQQAVEARNKKRASVQAVADSRKADAMTKRRGYASKGTTTMGAGAGMGIAKYATPNYQQTALKKAASPQRYLSPLDQAKNAYEYEKTRSDRKKAAPKAPSIAQKRAAASAKPVVAKVEKPSMSGIGVAGLSKAAPKAMNVTPSRTYTDKEKQINALLATGKKKDGTMKGSAQRKIQRIRRK
jgi:hypothetical protein